MSNILTAAEAANCLRCLTTDADMLALLPLVDDYIKDATGRDWTADTTIHPKAKAAARLLLTQWHENPGMIGQGITSLQLGFEAVIQQLEAIVLFYRTFEGLSSAGSIYLPGVREGDSVNSVIGVQGISGNQSANFETVISENDYIRQIAASDLDDKWFKALITPVGLL
jgi:hypothetical protein